MRSPHIPRVVVMRLLTLLLLALMVGQPLLQTSPALAAGISIGDGWWETANLRLHFFWNLYERRDGKYAEDWSENKLTAADTFMFGLRQAFLDMDITGHISRNHGNRVWVELNNTQTNYPDEYHSKQIYDYPPHVNIHLPWRNPNWSGDTNSHLYTSDAGQVTGLKVNYTTGKCTKGPTQAAAGTWVSKRDSACKVVYEESW
ncbi:MAG TPA: hypothetical protein VNK95_23525, partial [Caldilineaceae bacterium]|nr:hypothetical protein [Caldilineaceae bacterium]